MRPRLRPIPFAVALLASLSLSVTAAAQARYTKRADHDPDGIGVFYMGREIAHVMGHEGISWLDRPEREKEEAPTLLVKSLRLKPGDVVADVGAGSGYLSFMMAPKVLPGGKVLAEDIQPEMLDVIRKRAKEKNAPNVEPILGTIIDPKLPAGGVDLILLVDVYHELDHPYEMTQAMVKGLKVGGRLVLVEYRMEDPRVPIKLVHKMTQAQVKKEMTAFPELRWERTDDALPRQHILFFQKTK